ncbi:MAG TPA: hypothetical protein IGS37_01035 [Synechococcales cyanobacterium M55_K2018_004]|nr:hypothetical protein [Synechococcales cyanobacterium M55_K2018_004]
MQLHVALSETSVEQLVEHILTSRRISRADQERFMKALLSKNTLTEREQAQVNRVFDALRSGLLRVVD